MADKSDTDTGEKRQGLDWKVLKTAPAGAYEAFQEVEEPLVRHLPRNPADACRILAEGAFPGFEVDEAALSGIRDYCEEPALGKAHVLANKIAAVTEDWCIKAAGRGAGYRLWRSEIQYRDSIKEGYRLNVDFQVLSPGEVAPGSGTIYGPWPAGSGGEAQ